MKNGLIFQGLQAAEVVKALAHRDPATRRMVTTAIVHHGLAPVLAELQTLEPVLECTGDDVRTQAELADAARVSPEQLCEQLMPLTYSNMAWELVPLSVAIAAILKRSLEAMEQAQVQQVQLGVASHLDTDEGRAAADDDDLDDADLDSFGEEGEGDVEDGPSSSGSELPDGSVLVVGAFCEKLRDELSLLFFSHDTSLPLPTRTDAARIQELEVDSGCIELLSGLLRLLERSSRESSEEERSFEALVADHSFLVPVTVGEWIDALLGVVRTAPLRPSSGSPTVEQVPEL